MAERVHRRSGLAGTGACLVLLAFVAAASASASSSSEWDQWLAATTHRVVPRYSLNLASVPSDFRPTHADYQESMLVLSMLAVVGTFVALCCGGCFACAGASCMRACAKRRRPSRCKRRAWLTVVAASTVLVTATATAMLAGMHLSTVSSHLGDDIGHSLSPFHKVQGVVDHVMSTGQDLLGNSEAALQRTVELRNITLSLVPQVDDLQRSMNQLLGVLRLYPHAKELDHELVSLRDQWTIRDMPQRFPGLRYQLQALDTMLLSPVQAPLTSLNQEIASLQEVVNTQAVPELQFGLFFFMSLESSLIADARSNLALLHWLDSKESEVRPGLLAKQRMLVDAVLSKPSRYSSHITQHANTIDKMFLQGGLAFEAIVPIDTLMKSLSSSADDELKYCMSDLSQILETPLSLDTPADAKKLRNGLSFLEDRKIVDRMKTTLDQQFSAYQKAMKQVQSTSVASFLNDWSLVNVKIRAQLEGVMSVWTQFSTMFKESYQFVRDHMQLWWIYSHSMLVVLLITLLLGGATFICPRLLWIVLVLLAVAIIWCGAEMGLQLPASVAIADWCTAPEESIVSLLLEDTTIAKQLRSIHLYQFYSQGYTQDGAKEDDLLERFARYYLACQGYNLFVPLLEFADTELGNASARIDHMMNYTLIVPSTKNATVELQAMLTDGRNSLQHLQITDCGIVQVPFEEARAAICGDLLRDSLHLLVGRAVMVLCLLIALSSACLALGAHSNHSDAVAMEVPLLLPDEEEPLTPTTAYDEERRQDWADGDDHELVDLSPSRSQGVNAGTKA